MNLFKNKVFLSLLAILIIVLVAVFAIPKSNWNKIFSVNKTATVLSVDLPYIMDTDGVTKLYIYPEDNSTGLQWGGDGTTIGENAQSPTNGSANTIAIVNALGGGSDYAAGLCSNLSFGGYDDWYLPSKDQLNAMYNASINNGNTIVLSDYSGSPAWSGFAIVYYWSSTEDSDYPTGYAWRQHLSLGYQFNGCKYGDFRVRCVRSGEPEAPATEEDALTAVNDSLSSTTMQTALETYADLIGISVSDPSAYYSLTSDLKLAVSADVLTGKTDGGYISTSSIQTVFDTAVSDEALYTYTVADEQATITGYTGEGVDVTLPNILGGYPVTSIGDQAFSQNSSIISITIPDSITSIGMGTFAMISVTSINVGEGNPSYSSEDGILFDKLGTTLVAYPNAKSTSYVIPDSVTSIGVTAFVYNTSITSITIPNSVTSIGMGAFAYCSSLTSITIPDGVTSIAYGLFAYSTSLTSITISDNVTSIGDMAFMFCTSLTSVTIPDGVTSIGEYAFAGCSSLTSITIPDGVTSIGEYAFAGCSSLTSIDIPDGVTNIDLGAFNACTSLTSLTIGSGVTSIGDYAFGSCESLLSAYFTGDAPTEMGADVFDANADLFTVYYTEGKIGWANPWHGYTTATFGQECSDGDNDDICDTIDTCPNLYNPTLQVNLTSTGEAVALTPLAPVLLNQDGTVYINDAPMSYSGTDYNSLFVPYGIQTQSFVVDNNGSSFSLNNNFSFDTSKTTYVYLFRLFGFTGPYTSINGNYTAYSQFTPNEFSSNFDQVFVSSGLSQLGGEYSIDFSSQAFTLGQSEDCSVATTTPTVVHRRRTVDVTPPSEEETTEQPTTPSITGTTNEATSSSTSTSTTATTTESSSTTPTTLPVTQTPDTTPTPTPVPTPTETFTRNLGLYSIGNDVKLLQVYLNNHGFIISQTGAGSKGNETTTYGQKTVQAVKKFQEAHASELLTPYNLTQGTGYFGTATRKWVNENY